MQRESNHKNRKPPAAAAEERFACEKPGFSWRKQLQERRLEPEWKRRKNVSHA